MPNFTLEEELEDLDAFDTIVAEGGPEDEDIPDNPSVEETKSEEPEVEEKPNLVEEAEERAAEEGSTVTIESKTEAVADDRDSVIDDLRKQIEELHGTVLDLKSNAPLIKEEAPATEKAEPAKVDSAPQPATMEAVDFVGSLDMDDVASDPKVFNQVLNNAVNQAVTAAINKVNQTLSGVEKTVRELPTDLMQRTKQELLLDNKINAFYQSNEDLVGVRRTVGAVAAEIAAKEPKLSVDELFDKAAEQTRKLLKLPTPKPKAKSKGEFDDPAFAAKTSTRRQGKKVSDFQAELDEL